MQSAAQRLALPAWGGRVDSPSKRESAQARKMQKNAARTPSRVHALLGGFYGRGLQKVSIEQASNGPPSIILPTHEKNPDPSILIIPSLDVPAASLRRL